MIICCGNRNRKTDISSNTVEVEGGGSIDGDPPNSSAIVLSSATPDLGGDGKFRVAQNTFRLDGDPEGNPTSYPICGIMRGLNKGPTRFPADLGAALNYSEISANIFIGRASFGVLMFDANERLTPPPDPAVTPNDSNHNRIGANDLSAFTPSIAPLLVCSHAHDNTIVW